MDHGRLMLAISRFTSINFSEVVNELTLMVVGTTTSTQIRVLSFLIHSCSLIPQGGRKPILIPDHVNIWLRLCEVT
jgi:hypothetical protein